MGLSSKKTKTTPWSEAVEPLKQGIAQTQSTYQTAQPITSDVTGQLGGIFDSYAAKVGQANPLLQGTGAAAARTMRGDFLGSGPGAGTYTALSGANDPSIGLLSGMGGQRGISDYSVAPDAGVDAIRALGGGYRPQGGYDASRTAEGSAGADYFRDVAAGKYLDRNPYLDSIVNKTLDTVGTRVNNRFGAAGVGFGNSSDHAGILTRELADASNSLYGQAYEAERGRMGEAAGMLGEFDTRDRGFRLQADQARDAAGLSGYDSALRAGGLLSEATGRNAALGLDAARARDAASQAEFDGRSRIAGLLSDAWGRQSQTQLDAAKAGDAMWDAERARMVTTAGQVPQLAEAEFAGISPLLALSGGLLSSPWAATQGYNSGINTLTAPYSTQKSTPSMIDVAKDMTSIFTGIRGY